MTMTIFDSLPLWACAFFFPGMRVDLVLIGLVGCAWVDCCTFITVDVAEAGALAILVVGADGVGESES